MATVTFTIPAGVVTKLNNIAKAKGFATAKEMVVDFLKAELTYAATRAATKTATTTAEEAASVDAASIT